MRTNPNLIEIVTGDRGMLRGIEACVPKEGVVVVIEDLVNAFGTATQKFLEAIEADPNFAEVINHHLPELLCYKPFSVSANTAT